MSYTKLHRLESELLGRFNRSNREQIDKIRGFIASQLQHIKGERLDPLDKTSQAAVDNLLRRIGSKVRGSAHLDAFNIFKSNYDEIVKLQRDIFNDLGYDEVYDIALSDLSRVQAMSQATFTEIGGLRQVITDEIRAELSKAAFGNSTIKEITKNINNRLDKLASWGYTIASTGLMGFDRTVSDEFAKSLGIDTFTYFGPKDSKNRTFCAMILSGRNPNTGEPHKNLWTREEINTLDNGQKLNAMQYGGGYNCRHVWQPIPKET